MKDCIAPLASGNPATRKHMRSLQAQLLSFLGFFTAAHSIWADECAPQIDGKDPPICVDDAFFSLRLADRLLMQAEALATEAGKADDSTVLNNRVRGIAALSEAARLLSERYPRQVEELFSKLALFTDATETYIRGEFGNDPVERGDSAAWLRDEVAPRIHKLRQVIQDLVSRRLPSVREKL